MTGRAAEPERCAGYPADYAAFPGFTAAATGVLDQLTSALPGIDLWVVTRVDGDDYEVLARAGRWASTVPVGRRGRCAASLSARMAAGSGPLIAPDLDAVPAYRAAVEHDQLPPVRAYAGVPLFGFDRVPFGALCGIAGTAQTGELAGQLPLIGTFARLLSSLLSSERLAADRSSEAAAAYALADRDRVTGLRNRRGFEQMRDAEDARHRLYGTQVSVLLVHLDVAGRDSGDIEMVARQVAEVLCAAACPCDVVARLEQDQFALLATETGENAAAELVARLRRALRAVPAMTNVASATKRGAESLLDAQLRATRQVSSPLRLRSVPHLLIPRYELGVARS